AENDERKKSRQILEKGVNQGIAIWLHWGGKSCGGRRLVDTGRPGHIINYYAHIRFPSLVPSLASAGTRNRVPAPGQTLVDYFQMALPCASFTSLAHCLVMAVVTASGRAT